MKKYLLLLFAAGTVALTAFVAPRADVYFEVAKNIDIFTRVYKEIAFNYVDQIDAGEFLRAGIRGMLGSLDPYTIFVDEKRQDDIDLITNGKYGGIGITIGIRDERVTIIEIIDGYSAQKQGLRIGDVIFEVNSKPITRQNFDDVSLHVKGEPGTFVNLKVLRNNLRDTVAFELLREEIVVKNVTFAGFYPENSGTAYIKLAGFSRSGAEELKKALTGLREQKEITSVILDLRGNPGGLLDVAVDIANKFLPKNSLIVSTKGRDSSSLKQYLATQEPLLKDAMLVLLVNDGSASASEIVTGAIQDHDRGIILGEKTFGKGLVQTITPLSYNTSLKITTAKYYTPSGRCIQKIDYSKGNKSVTAYDTILSSAYTTDNKRVVYSGGGITPDSLVPEPEQPQVVQDLFAKGLFFKYGNHYLAKHDSSQFSKGKDEELFKDFISFLKDEKYTFTSEIEKKLDELVSVAAKHTQYKNLQDKVEGLRKDVRSANAVNYDAFMQELIAEIRIELAARYGGSTARIKERLNYDAQFRAALGLLANPAAYKKLLSKN